MPEKWTGKLEKVDDYRWRIPKSYKSGMRVDGLIYATEAMLDDIRSKRDRPTVFGKSLKTQRRLYEKQRVRIATKLKNPRIKRISFHFIGVMVDVAFSDFVTIFISRIVMMIAPLCLYISQTYLEKVEKILLRKQ